MADKKRQKKSKKKPKDIIIENAECKMQNVENDGSGEEGDNPSPSADGTPHPSAKPTPSPRGEGKGRQRDERGRFVKGHTMVEGAGFEPGNLEASKYQKKFCADMLRFFDDVYAEGNYPTFEMFASSIGVTARTLENWVRAYPEFSDAYTACKNKQRGALLEGAMAGRFNATFAKFVAVNCHGMKEKVEVDDKHSGGLDISVSYFEGEEE